MREDRPVVMTGVESVEWDQTRGFHGFHGFQVFDAILFAPFPPIIMSRPPLSSLLWCVMIDRFSRLCWLPSEPHESGEAVLSLSNTFQ